MIGLLSVSVLVPFAIAAGINASAQVGHALCISDEDMFRELGWLHRICCCCISSTDISGDSQDSKDSSGVNELEMCERNTSNQAKNNDSDDDVNLEDVYGITEELPQLTDIESNLRDSLSNSRDSIPNSEGMTDRFSSFAMNPLAPRPPPLKRSLATEPNRDSISSNSSNSSNNITAPPPPPSRNNGGRQPRPPQRRL